MLVPPSESRVVKNTNDGYYGFKHWNVLLGFEVLNRAESFLKLYLMKKTIRTLFALSAFIGLSSISQAAAIATVDDSATQNAFAGGIVANDLVNQGQSTLSSYDAGAETFGPDGLNDGSGDIASTTENTYYNNDGVAQTIQFDLNTAVNTQGYDLTSIIAISGWASDTNFNYHDYTVQVSVVGSATYTDLVTVDTTATTASRRVTITDDATGVLASGVDSIRFVMPADHGRIVMQEIDVIGTATASMASPVTWDDGAADDNWSSTANWDGDVAPVNGDSVVLTATTQSYLDYAWTIESGESLTAETAVLTGNGYGDDLSIVTGGTLTLATGGTMNIGFMRPRSDATSGGDFMIQPGASLNTMVYGLSSKELNITYIADAAGVTTWTNSLSGAGIFNIGGDHLTVDLTNYDIANGSTLILADYAAAGDLNGTTFASVTLTEGWNGTIDYAYDQGSGDLAIALKNITPPGPPITWDNSGNGNWTDATMWVGDVAPVTGDGKDVDIDFGTGNYDVNFNTTYTVESGRTLESRTRKTGFHPELAIQAGSALTLATGGTIDLAFMRPRATADFTIEAGATLNTDIYGLGNNTLNITYTADAAGVTTWNNSDIFDPRLDNLIVDLSNYDTANGDTLVLVDYGSLVNGYEFASVTLTESWSGTIDYAYDQGGGDLAIALTNISIQALDETAQGTPHSWLDLYGLVTGGDYEAADLLDSDGDGKLNWEEYRDGTDPTGVGVAAPIPFTLVEGTNGDPDTLTFSPPNTAWHIEASTDDTVWGVVPHMTFVVNADGTITASVEALPALNAGGTYRVIETQKNRKLVIFLTEGQSNMVGYAPDTDTNVYGMADHPLPNMLQLSHGHARHFYDSEAENALIPAFQPLQASEDPGQSSDEADTALDFYFARAYAEDHPNEDVLIIKNAYGGTGFANNRWNDGDSLDALVIPYFEGAFKQNDLSNRYETIEFGGILWHQGEADTKTVAASSAYAANLVAMVARHRSRVDTYVSTEDTPFILGTMHYYRIDNYYSNFPEMSTVDAIHRDIANLIPNADCVDLHDLQGNTTIHFSVDEYKTMGARYYQKWLELSDTSNGTPYAWLQLYGLVSDGDYEAADLLDSDSDGRLNWEEYQDGTDPTGVGVAAPIPFTLVDASDGSADTLTFAPPNTKWVIEASSDNVEWGVVPQVTFVVNADGSITATAPQLETLNPSGTYRVVETSENTKLVIFLTEGQSNMVGWSGKTFYEMDDYPCSNMFQLSRGLARLEYAPGTADSIVQAFQPLQTTVDRSGAATSRFVSLDFYFAREYAKAHPDEDVLIVKNARGGTGFVNNYWNAGDSQDVLADPYLAAVLAQVSGEYTTIEFGGILWHQGETDAKDAASAAAYSANLTALFARHRAVADSYFPGTQSSIVIGTMVPANIQKNSTGYYDDIDAIHRDISNLVADAGVADLSSISGEAGQHFLADGYQTAGELYYQKWLELETQIEQEQTWLDVHGLVTGGDYAAAMAEDSDGDGKFNWQESQYGTNPAGHLPTEPSVLNLQVGNPSSDDSLTFMPPNTAWVLKVSADLSQWEDVSEALFTINADGSVTVNTEHNAELSKRFYKLVETGW